LGLRFRFRFYAYSVSAAVPKQPVRGKSLDFEGPGIFFSRFLNGPPKNLIPYITGHL
jgi:hypothetical protein